MKTNAHGSHGREQHGKHWVRGCTRAQGALTRPLPLGTRSCHPDRCVTALSALPAHGIFSTKNSQCLTVAFGLDFGSVLSVSIHPAPGWEQGTEAGSDVSVSPFPKRFLPQDCFPLTRMLQTKSSSLAPQSLASGSPSPTPPEGARMFSCLHGELRALAAEPRLEGTARPGPGGQG